MGIYYDPYPENGGVLFRARIRSRIRTRAHSSVVAYPDSIEGAFRVGILE